MAWPASIAPRCPHSDLPCPPHRKLGRSTPAYCRHWRTTTMVAVPSPPLVAPPQPVDVSRYIVAIVVGSCAFCVLVRWCIHIAHVNEWASRRPESQVNIVPPSSLETSFRKSQAAGNGSRRSVLAHNEDDEAANGDTWTTSLLSVVRGSRRTTERDSEMYPGDDLPRPRKV